MSVIKSVLHRFNGTGTTTKVCSTRRIGDCFFECRVKRPNPKYCDFSLSSGAGYICNHADREAFSKK